MQSEVRDVDEMAETREQADIHLEFFRAHKGIGAGGFFAVDDEIGNHRLQVKRVERERSDFGGSTGAFFHRCHNFLADVIPEPVGLDDQDSGGEEAKQEDDKANRAVTKDLHTVRHGRAPCWFAAS